MAQAPPAASPWGRLPVGGRPGPALVPAILGQGPLLPPSWAHTALAKASGVYLGTRGAHLSTGSCQAVLQGPALLPPVARSVDAPTCQHGAGPGCKAGSPLTGTAVGPAEERAASLVPSDTDVCWCPRDPHMLMPHSRCWPPSAPRPTWLVIDLELGVLFVVEPSQWTYLENRCMWYVYARVSVHTYICVCSICSFVACTHIVYAHTIQFQSNTTGLILVTPISDTEKPGTPCLPCVCLFEQSLSVSVLLSLSPVPPQHSAPLCSGAAALCWITPS